MSDKITIDTPYMMRLTERDVKLMNDIGMAGLLTYKHIMELGYFPSYASCSKRIRLLQDYDYVRGTFYQTNEKVFILQKEGVKALSNLVGIEYRVEDFTDIFHKLMRSELFIQLRKYNVQNWKNEARVVEAESIFDVYFEYEGVPNFVEVHNAQKAKVLRQKLEKCLRLPYKFVFIIYCRRKDLIRKLIDKMDDDGFSTNRHFAIKVYEHGDCVDL